MEKPKKKTGAKKGVPFKTPHDDLFKPDTVEAEVLAESEDLPDIADDVPDLFETGATGRVKRLGGREKWAHDTNILKVEWSIKYATLTPRQFLCDIKLYSLDQAKKVLDYSGGVESWKKERALILDKMTESTVKRHIDQLAEVQETHVKASKIGLAKAIEMLTKMNIDPARDKKGKLIIDGKGKPIYKGFRSIDLLNTLSSIEKAQQIYRRAMGLPNDSNGLAQIMEKVDQINVQNNHLHYHAPDKKEESSGELEKKLSYEEIVELIEFRRERKKLKEAEEEEGVASDG